MFDRFTMYRLCGHLGHATQIPFPNVHSPIHGCTTCNLDFVDQGVDVKQIFANICHKHV